MATILPYYFEPATHFPVLMKLVQETTGPILELGTGFYSTVYLHYACLPTKRTLVSYDHWGKWARPAQQFEADFHEVHELRHFARADIEKPWEIAFVDHGPLARRKVDVARLAAHAKYVIVHDTDPKYEHFYQFSEVFPQYKYRYDFTALSPHTTVLSNFVDLSSFSV